MTRRAWVAEAGTLSIEATPADAGVASLGVWVEFHPGIDPVMRPLVLEAALRHWDREVGAVTRGDKPEWAGRRVWMRGWALRRPDERADVFRVRIAYQNAADAAVNEEKASGE